MIDKVGKIPSRFLRDQIFTLHRYTSPMNRVRVTRHKRVPIVEILTLRKQSICTGFGQPFQLINFLWS